MKLVLRNKDKGTMFQRYSKSFMHAVDGIIYAFKYEHNMIIIGISALFTIIMGFLFKVSITEWFFIISVIGLVAATEMINTSIEATIDLVTIKEHPLAKIAKDTASSASLILSLTALIGGIIIFLPKIINLL